MTPYEKLSKEIKDKQNEVSQLQNKLKQLVADCKHDWDETKYVPEYIPAYTIPGDPPGTMGVDWRGPVHVDSKTIKRWQRTCKKCGYVQATTKVEKEIHTTVKPDWK